MGRKVLQLQLQQRKQRKRLHQHRHPTKQKGGGNQVHGLRQKGGIQRMRKVLQLQHIRVGEIVVFKVEGRDIPIVHRVLKLHEKEDGSVKFLTKGDNNSVDDRGLYAPGQFWLTKKDVVGRARGFLPYVGIVTIIMNEYPKFKYAVLACLGFYVLIHRE